MQTTTGISDDKGATKPQRSIASMEIETDQERRRTFLRYVNRGWLVLGLVALLTLPLFPNYRDEFGIAAAITVPTSVVVMLLNRKGRTHLAGALLTLVANFGFYGLFLVLVEQRGAYQAFATQATVWMLMGISVLFAGAFVNKWAAPITSLVDTILLITTRLVLAPASEPRPSVVVFWWMLALVIWFYEGTLSRSLARAWAELADRQKAEEKLIESEKRFRSLSDAAFEGIMIHDKGTILNANQAFADLFGIRDPADLIGKRGLDTLPLAPSSRELLKTKLDLGTPEPLEITVIRSDGSTFPAETQGRDIIFEDERLRVVAIRDITERRLAQNQLSRYAQVNRTLYELSQEILTSSDVDGILAETHQAVRDLMPCDAFVIAIVGSSPDEIDNVYLWDQGRRWTVGHYPTEHSLTGYVISSGKPLLVNEWDESHTRLTESRIFSPTEAETHSVLAVPLFQTGGTCFGMMSTQSYSSNVYTSEHEQLLVTLANPISKAIENAQLLASLQRTNLELSNAYDATIEGWSRAMDLRDKETEGHTQRVTALTMKLARAMRYPEPDMIHFRRGALLHDIGKMGVPDEILYSAQRLTKKEWEIMRRHPMHAYDLLSRIDFLRPALDIPYCHHEKWDGSGYPRGLRGEQIPVAARIFAIVDVWDALTNDRPYRPAWSKKRALKYIQAESGRHFDPKVVDMFLKVLGSELA